MPGSAFDNLPSEVRSILVDLIEHEDSSVGETITRTGYPADFVTAAVERLRAENLVITTTDSADPARILVRPHPENARTAIKIASAPIVEALAAALGQERPDQLERIEAKLALADKHLDTGPFPPS